MSGNVELSEYAIQAKNWLTYKAQTVVFQNITIEGLNLDSEGNISIIHCKLKSSKVFMDSANVSNCLTLYKSELNESTIVCGSPSKNMKISLIGCTIYGCHDKYCDRMEGDYQGAIVFDIGPAATIYVEIVETWFHGAFVLTGEQESNNISLYIHHSEILNPNYRALSINLNYRTRNNNIQVQIADSNISGEQGLGLVFDAAFPNAIEIVLTNTNFINYKYTAMEIRTPLSVKYAESDPVRTLGSETVVHILMENCTYINNENAIVIEVESDTNLKLKVFITDSTFYGNKNAIAFRRKILQTLLAQTTITRHLFVSLRNVTVENNCPRLYQSGVISLVDVDMLTLEDCRIVNNQGTAIASYYSGVTLAGNISFSNNTSIKGGALLLYESYMHLTASSNIYFFNNYAQEVGGAIYVKQRPYIRFNVFDYPPCFHQMNSVTDITQLSINFYNNLASSGGDDIYGGSLYSICRHLTSSLKDNFKFNTSLIAKVFHFQHKTLSSVSSDPTRVCLCDDQATPQCANIEYIFRKLPPRYPGEVFSVSAVVVGNDFGTVPGIVHSNMLYCNQSHTTEVPTHTRNQRPHTMWFVKLYNTIPNDKHNL